FVRRYTGGGLVEHGRDLTYTLVLPADHPLTAAGTLPSYRAIHEGVASALQAAGVECQLATAQPKKDHASCFLKPVPADVLDSKGAKLAGAAQRRTKQGCLHQGSILLSGQIPPQLPKVLPDHLARALQTTWAVTERTREEEELAEKLFRDRYSTREWNYSR
ncbi:MAG: biotin/lipoate A/B protein ligase family protein, partial [Verrucomicrobiota bacterium]